MKNTVQKGMILEFAAPAGGVVSGLTYKIGALVCVAMVTATAGEPVSFSTEGVFQLVKETTADFSEGDSVFWDDTAKEWDESAAGRFPAGTCVKAAAGGTVLVEVKLVGFGVVAV